MPTARITTAIQATEMPIAWAVETLVEWPCELPSAAAADGDDVADAVDTVASGVAFLELLELTPVRDADVSSVEDVVCGVREDSELEPNPAVDVCLVGAVVFAGTVSVLCVAVTALRSAEQI